MAKRKTKQSTEQQKTVDSAISDLLEQSSTEGTGSNLPDGTYYSFLRFPSDQPMRGIPCERIVQVVVIDGSLRTYITESSYMGFEAMLIFNRLVKHGYDFGIKKRKRHMVPYKDRIRWLEVDLSTGAFSARVNPETGEKV